MTTSVSQYAANLGGALGQQASAAASANTAATAVQTEAQTRLQSVEGVNLDEELVNLTTYQQAYNASARLIQASQRHDRHASRHRALMDDRTDPRGPPWTTASRPPAPTARS